MSDTVTNPSIGRWALIVDDHPLFCDALELTLKSVADFTMVRTANSLAAALDELEGLPAPSIILLDLNLPDVSGLDGLVKLKAAINPCPVIVVSSMCENAMISAALHAGASGFVPKHSRRAIFKEALQVVGANEIYKPPGYVETPDMDDKLDTVERLASLTRQQTCILDLICEGKLNKQIAYELSIAETTVKAHVTAIMRKLGVQSRTQAVLVAQQAKFSNVLPESD